MDKGSLDMEKGGERSTEARDSSQASSKQNHTIHGLHGEAQQIDICHFLT